MLFYAQSRTMAENGKSSFKEDLLKISSGLFFAVATLLRTNGLLSGTIFLYDVASGTGYVALTRLKCYNPSQRSSEPVAWASCTSGQCNVQSQERNFRAIMAVTSFHIQIVNRIASGYPMWYLVIAQWLVDSQSTDRTEKPSPKAQWIIRGFVVYSLVQGMLYANFLPPA
ncbi:hypothetical protein CFE70_005938 [Pyrenophora teres f. teres 0-1]